MPVTRPQAEALATLAADARPHGARRWETPGILAAIAKVRHLHLADVALAVFRAADDRELETPGAIANTTASCWRERNTDRPTLVARSTGPWCQTCGQTREDHRGDHEFELPAVKRDGEAVVRIVDALRAEVRPLRETTPTHEAADAVESNEEQA